MTKIFLATLLAFTATPVLAEPITIASTVQTADLDLRVRRASRRSIAAWHFVKERVRHGVGRRHCRQECSSPLPRRYAGQSRERTRRGSLALPASRSKWLPVD